MSATRRDRGLDLKVGCHTGGEGPKTSTRQASVALLLEPGSDNPWELEALVAVADSVDLIPGRDHWVPPGTVLAALRDALWDGPPRDAPLLELLPELLHTVSVKTNCLDFSGAPLRAPVTLLAVKEGNWHLFREGEAAAYLFRRGRLHALPSMSQQGSPAPRPGVYSEQGELQDGDAFLLCSGEVRRTVDLPEISSTLSQAYTPRAAAVRLADTGSGRAHLDCSTAVLFVGAGPALAPVHPADVTLSAHEPASQAASQGGPVWWKWAAVGGALLVVGFGIGLGASGMFRPRTDKTSGPAVPNRPVLSDQPATPTPRPAGSPGTTRPPVPIPPNQTTSQPTGPAIGSPPGNNPRLSGRPLPSTTSGSDGSVPMHTIVPGLKNEVGLTAIADSTTARFILMANQGSLLSDRSPQAIPAGSPLPIPLGAKLFEEWQKGEAELRLVDSRGQNLLRAGNADLVNLLAAGTKGLPFRTLSPGDYQLIWQTTRAPFVVRLRVVGLQ